MLFLTILSGGINLAGFVLAQEGASDVITERPQIKYKSGKLRDPFSTYLVKEEKKEVSLQPGEGQLIAPTIDLNSLKVQGIIWGGKMPQAIINGEVLSVGDVVNGAKILSIDKKGINLDFSGEVINLSASGQNPEARQNEK